MLVITREPGESIVIGEEIRVRIVRVKGKRVRVGIAAPKEKSIRREETRNAQEKQNT